MCFPLNTCKLINLRPQIQITIIILNLLHRKPIFLALVNATARQHAVFCNQKTICAYHAIWTALENKYNFLSNHSFNIYLAAQCHQSINLQIRQIKDILGNVKNSFLVHLSCKSQVLHHRLASLQHLEIETPSGRPSRTSVKSTNF